MQGKGLLNRGKDSVIYVTSDGCPKQYKCANAVKLQQILAKIYNLSLDWMVTCPHHGKSLVDALAGLDKFLLRNGYTFGITSAQREQCGKKLSEAEKAVEFLNNPGWGEGDTKHKKEDGNRG